jgi:hypothetical protein
MPTPLFEKGDPRINRKGAPKLTPEQKIIKKATKDFKKDYIEKLTQALEHLSPVLIKEASKGNMQAIKEINDRVLGRPRESVDHKFEGEISHIVRTYDVPREDPKIK